MIKINRMASNNKHALRRNGLRYWRVEKTFSQDELSIAAKVSRHSIQRYEHGTRPLELTEQERIAKVLGLNIADIFSETDLIQ